MLSLIKKSKFLKLKSRNLAGEFVYLAMLSFFEYAHTDFIIQHGEGLNEFVKAEITEVGAKVNEQGFRVSRFNASPLQLVSLVYTARVSSRILMPLFKFSAFHKNKLYGAVRKFPWHSYISKNESIAVSASVHNSAIKHSQYAALTVKDAIVDEIRSETGVRPDVNVQAPDFHLVLSIQNNNGELSLDLSGPLHLRGYRQQSSKAPMRETLAGAIILSIEEKELPIVDLMTGSGTLILEALMNKAKIPSGYLRRDFPLFKIPEFDELFQQQKKKMNGEIISPPAGFLTANDHSAPMIETAKYNASALPESAFIHWEQKDFRKLPGFENQVLLCNPPYGIRQGDKKNLQGLYRDLGDFLKKKCTGAAAYIYFGEREFIAAIGLHPKWKKTMRSGALDGRLVKFELY
ncbi:MAG TPA: class I SAM-dependent RNA methyltransferase [Candidatus Marinimicrobia bacterium]|nr:class I SAM-dependent RNA methyltransferase [Candidatus Neomarinimicrobiota bacterium]